MNKTVVDEISRLIENSQNITVFSGAGISTNCGIPDFRGEKGIYEIVRQKYSLPYPEAVFDIEYFKKDPAPFFDLSKELFNDGIKPSLTHEFVARLEKMGKISLVMTQNIDLLHRKAGSSKVIECHGSYLTARCLECGSKYGIKDIESDIKKGKVPRCRCGGIIKPDIVFFGEQLPKEFYDKLEDPPLTDLLLVLGTSLIVQPAASFALKLAQRSRSVIVNLEPTAYDSVFTYAVNEDLDEFTRSILDNIEKGE